MSVHNEYTGYTLKHLLLRHMYNLSLPNLCATRSSPVTLRFLLLICTLLKYLAECALTLYCVVTYIVACVDASRMVFWDRSVLC